MIDTIDLCEDANGPRSPNVPFGDQPCHRPPPLKPALVQPTQPTQFETGRHPRETDTFGSSPSASGPHVSEYRAYPELFYVDFITTIENAFPWQTFAIRHRISATDLRHMFFVLVTLPLADPDDNVRRLKVAQGACKRFGEWRQAWEETVANIRAQESQSEDTNELQGTRVLEVENTFMRTP